MNHMVARIAYVNTEPFFFHWPLHDFPLFSGFPRELADKAGSQNNNILGGPLPLVETWGLEDGFEPLQWGISAERACQSVFLLSHEPISSLNGVTVGLTPESANSVALLEVLFKERYRHHVNMRRGLRPDDDAWLVIGDQALRIFAGPRTGQWPYLTDLATEWWDWHHLPFVFARWVMKKNVGVIEKNHLLEVVRRSLAQGLNSISTISFYQSTLLGIPAQTIVRYLRGFQYVLGEEEERSIRVFKELVTAVRAGPLKTV